MAKKLTPEQIQAIETACGYGLSLEKAAKLIGISRASFFRHKSGKSGASVSAEVNAAIEKGKAKASFNVTKAAYEMATSKEYPCMTRFWLKVQENWKETDVVEHTGKDGDKIEVVITDYRSKKNAAPTME